MFLKIFTEVNFTTALRKTSLLTKYQCNKLLPLATEVCFVILSSISEVTEILSWKAGSRKKKSENKNMQVAKDKIETCSKPGKI